jgi:hypothetical protein
MHGGRGIIASARNPGLVVPETDQPADSAEPGQADRSPRPVTRRGSKRRVGARTTGGVDARIDHPEVARIRAEPLAKPTRRRMEVGAMRRIPRAVAVAFGAVLLTGQLVAADKPERTPYAIPPVQSFAAGEVCPYPVELSVVVNKAYTKLFAADKHGDVRESSNGRLVLRVTNLASGESQVFNSSGPSTSIYRADGTTIDVVVRGQTVYWFYQGEPLGPNLYLTNGRLSIEFSPDFAVLSATHSGKLTSICELLA